MNAARPSVPHTLRRIVLTTALFLLGGLALGMAQPAMAGSGLWVTLENHLPGSGVAGYPKVSIAEPGADQIYCWYTENLAYVNRDANQVTQGASRSFYTETQQGGAPCLTSYGQNAMDVGIYLKTSPTAKWLSMLPESRAQSMSLRFEKQSDICNWTNNDDLDYCFVVRRSLGTFVVPKHDFPGLLCWTIRSTADTNGLRGQNGKMTFTVRSDDACNTPRGQTVLPSKSGAPVYRDYPAPEEAFPAPKASTALDTRAHAEMQANPDPSAPPADDPGKDEGVIVSFMSSAGVACDMMAILPAEGCKDVGKNEFSNFSNLTTDVRKFKLTDSFGTVNERENICSSESVIPAGAGNGSVSCSKSVSIQKSTTTTTTKGWKVGGGYKNSFEYQTPTVAKILAGEWKFKHEITITGEYNSSTATARTSGETTQNNVQVSQNALPGMITKIDVFTQSASVNYTYDADLDLGARGAVQAVSTPAAKALGMSPSLTQHCLAYVVGGPAANGSLMERQKRMLDSGMSATDPSLPRAQQLLLASAPYYRAGSVACPGMPSMFPSTAGFTGRGVGQYGSTGYGPDGKPLQSWMVCVYTMPLSRQHSAAATGDDQPVRRETQGSSSSPCVQQKVDGPQVPVQHPGQYVDLSHEIGAIANQATGSTFTGGPGSEEVIGTPRADTITTGRGAMQVVRSQGGDDVVDATEGTDQVEAGPGDDTVAVGSTDTAYGNQGNDDLSVAGARNSVLLGGPGNDVLRSTSSTAVGLGGGPGADRMTVTGSSKGVQMAGGPGSDTYVISGTSGAAPREFEMPNQGYDEIDTDRSITAPLYVERVVATGEQPVNLTSNDGRQMLVGNDAPNVLAPGIGADSADGGGGNDAFLMNWDAPDSATGGPGADLFIPLGTPATARNGGLAPRAMAHRITDFTPAEGDRIQLRSKVFGTSVNQLSNDWQVIVGTSPQATLPTATILANPATGLLAFDRDGSGPIIPKVIAMVPDAGAVAPSWFAVS